MLDFLCSGQCPKCFINTNVFVHTYVCTLITKCTYLGVATLFNDSFVTVLLIFLIAKVICAHFKKGKKVL